jgi:transcriptional regulator with XRE-family HTH domain
MLTGTQIRIARTALRWSAEELASQSGVGSRTIKRIEMVAGLPSSNVATLAKLKNSLEAAGIEFIGSPEDRPGIRIGKPRQ